jgi:hypothetical protein
MAGTLQWPPVDDSPAATLPAFKAGDRVNLYPRVTGGCHKATVIRSRYSGYFQCWTYDIIIMSNRSAMYPKGHMQHGVTESEIGPRL